MRRVTIAVIGNAKTTRANVEALIGDIVDSVDEAAVVTVFDKKQSDGQIWAEQYATDKGLQTGVYDHNDYTTMLREQKNEIKFFVLWDDEDPECQLAASIAQANKIQAFDLTDGLIMIPLNSEPISKPAVADVPELEASVSSEPVEPQLSTPTINQPVRVTIGELETFFTDVPEEEGEEEEDEEEDDSEVIDDLGDLMKALIEEMATIFADKVAEELIAKFKNLS
jgi:hypothetical protein